MLKIINICIFIGFTGYRFRKEASPCHIIDMFAKKIIMNSQLLINRIHFLYPFHRTQFFLAIELISSDILFNSILW